MKKPNWRDYLFAEVNGINALSLALLIGLLVVVIAAAVDKALTALRYGVNL
jgi:hypothetical protein